MTVSAMLSNHPRAPFEPKPTSPLLSATWSPPMMRGANVYEKAFLPSMVTVTTKPFTTTFRLYHLPALTDPGTLPCATVCQPDALRYPMTILFVDWSTPANLKSVGEK